ncbi:hypothetical protein GCM10007902_34980 [Dyella nitratireducens]|nr:hypothetical protein GCM10007902_34980 [Dyella nitratireducens]
MTDAIRFAGIEEHYLPHVRHYFCAMVVVLHEDTAQWKRHGVCPGMLQFAAGGTFRLAARAADV